MHSMLQHKVIDAGTHSHEGKCAQCVNSGIDK